MAIEIAKTVATSMIWLCVAIMLAGGLFRMNGGAPEFYFFTTIATNVIWQHPKRSKKLKSGRGFDVVVPVQPVDKPGPAEM